MAEPQRDLDGVEKNIDKLSKEWARTREYLKPEWQRFLKTPWDGHSYVNLFVEARRVSPYLSGHVDAIMYPVLIILATVGWML
jgi:hypothetical protein